jgi:hypothetical protein
MLLAISGFFFLSGCSGPGWHWKQQGNNWGGMQGDEITFGGPRSATIQTPSITIR